MKSIHRAHIKANRELGAAGLGFGLVIGLILGWAATRAAFEVPASVILELEGVCPTCERGWPGSSKPR